MASKSKHLLNALQGIPSSDLHNTLVQIGNGSFKFDKKPLSKLPPEELALRLERLMIQATGIKQESRICRPYFRHNPRIFNNYINQFCAIIEETKYRGFSGIKISLAYGLMVQKSRIGNINSSFVRKTAAAVIITGVVIVGLVSALWRAPVSFLESFLATNEHVLTQEIYAASADLSDDEKNVILVNNIQEDYNSLEDSDLYLPEYGQLDELSEALDEELVEALLEDIVEEPDEEPIEELAEELAEDFLEEIEPAVAVFDRHLTNLARNHGIRSVTFMWYSQVTNPTARQFHLLHTLDLITHTDDGFVKIGDYYAVALGSQFGPIGSKFVIRSADGSEIRVIKADAKADIHTINGFAHAEDHSIVEFLLNVNNDVIRQIIQDNPGASRNAALNRHCRTKFSGCIRYIYRVADDGLIELVRETTWAHNNWPRV